MFRILDLSREETSDADVERVRAIFQNCGAVEAGRAFCRNLMDKGRLALAETPENLRTTLIGFFEGLLDRKK